MERKSMMLSDVPDEIIEEILQFVGIRNLISVIPVVCKRWNRLSETPRLFRKFHTDDEKVNFNLHGGIRKYFIAKFDTKKWFDELKDVFGEYDMARKSRKVQCVGGLFSRSFSRSSSTSTNENNCVRIIESIDKKGEFSVYFSHVRSKYVRYNKLDAIFDRSGELHGIEIIEKEEKKNTDERRNYGVVRFDSFNHLLSCACADGYVRIIDTRSNTFLPTKYGRFEGKPPENKSVRWDYYQCTDSCFVDSGEKIFGCGVMHEVKLFDIETGKVCQEWKSNYDETLDICSHRIVSPKCTSSSSFFVLGCSEGLIEIWARDDSRNNKPVSTLKINNGMYPHTSLSLVGEHRLVVGTQVGNYSNVENEDGNVQIFDLRNLKHPQKLHGVFKGDNRGNIQSLHFDHFRGMSVNVYGSCCCWSSLTGEHLGTLHFPFGSGPRDVHFTNDGRVFAVAYENPQSAWMGTVGVVFDGRRKGIRKFESDNSESSSKCEIQ